MIPHHHICHGLMHDSLPLRAQQMALSHAFLHWCILRHSALQLYSVSHASPPAEFVHLPGLSFPTSTLSTPTCHAPQVYHVLNTPPAGWSQGSGFITADLIKERLPSPGPDTLVLKCGPPPMIEAMRKHLEALQYSQEMLFDF